MLIDALHTRVGFLEGGLDLAGNGLVRAKGALAGGLVEVGHERQEFLGDSLLICQQD